MSLCDSSYNDFSLILIIALTSVLDLRRYVSPDFGGSVVISNPLGQPAKRVLSSVADKTRFSFALLLTGR